MRLRIAMAMISVGLTGCWPRLGSGPVEDLKITPTQRVLIYGDAGSGSESQQDVGRAMGMRHEARPFQFAVSTGDNRYIDGPEVYSRIFESPYQALIQSGIVFYQTMGNHDLEGNRLQEALDYSRVQPRYFVSSGDYVVQRSHLKVVVLNVATAAATLDFPPARAEFLRAQICSRTQPWVAVMMHYPIFSTGTRGDEAPLLQSVLPVLRECPPEFVFSGHDHHAELFEPQGNTWFAIVGNSGQAIGSTRNSSSAISAFHLAEHGFAELNVNATEAQLLFVDRTGSLRFSKTRSK